MSDNGQLRTAQEGMNSFQARTRELLREVGKWPAGPGEAREKAQRVMNFLMNSQMDVMCVEMGIKARGAKNA